MRHHYRIVSSGGIREAVILGPCANEGCRRRHAEVSEYGKPVRISDLPQARLAEILSDVYEIVFWTGSDYDPDKELGADEIGEIVNVFRRYGLQPIPMRPE